MAQVEIIPQMNDALFNQLPLIQESKEKLNKISENNEELLMNLLITSIGDIIVRYNMQDKIQACLVHKHYNLKDKEYQLTKIYKNNGQNKNYDELIAEPNYIDNQITIPYKWALINQQWYSYEYFDNQVPYNEIYKKYGQEFEQNNQLQKDLALVLINYHLQDFIGISLQFQPLFQDGQGMAVEVNNINDRQSKLLLIYNDYQKHDAYLQIQKLPNINTCWRFFGEYDEQLQMWKIKASNNLDCKGHHHTCICFVCS